MYVSNLQSLTTFSLSDIPLWGIVIGGYAFYRYVICNYFLNSISKMVKAKNEIKFTHRLFDLIHYSSSAILGFLSLCSRPYFITVFWARGNSEVFMQHDIYECTIFEKIYFMLFASYYVVDVFYLWTNTSDKTALIIHHIVTLGMIFSSVFLCVPVLGLTIMLLHDVVDVPLYTGKIASYLGFTRVKDISLLSFAVLCTWFRMINYPIIVYYAFVNIPLVTFYKSLYVATCVLLISLYGCHIYWFIHILRAAINIFVSEGEKAIRDNRSD